MTPFPAPTMPLAESTTTVYGDNQECGNVHNQVNCCHRLKHNGDRRRRGRRKTARSERGSGSDVAVSGL